MVTVGPLSLQAADRQHPNVPNAQKTQLSDQATSFDYDVFLSYSAKTRRE